MSWQDDRNWYEQDAAMEAFLQEELRRIAEEPVFSYLAVYGDAIEARVKRCLDQARTLSDGVHRQFLGRRSALAPNRLGERW
jgi:hypothetical protein